MENSIYIKALELGEKRGSKGISFYEMVEELKIEIPNDSFKVNLMIWFYTNFYNKNLESRIVGQQSSINDTHRINERVLPNIAHYNTQESYIKGEALNKYIDFVELQRTREASKKATIFAYASILIASLSIILPFVLPKYYNPTINIEAPKKWNERSNSILEDSIRLESGEENMSNTEAETKTKLDSIN